MQEQGRKQQVLYNNEHDDDIDLKSQNREPRLNVSSFLKSKKAVSKVAIGSQVQIVNDSCSLSEDSVFDKAFADDDVQLGEESELCLSRSLDCLLRQESALEHEGPAEWSMIRDKREAKSIEPVISRNQFRS